MDKGRRQHQMRYINTENRRKEDDDFRPSTTAKDQKATKETIKQTATAILSLHELMALLLM
jgi:hypothetical protein